MPTAVRKIAVPIDDQNPIHNAKGTDNTPNKWKVTVFSSELNIIMYMPVDAATVGGIPSPINTGLNTIPPPRPIAEASPPHIEAVASLAIDGP